MPMMGDQMSGAVEPLAWVNAVQDPPLEPGWYVARYGWDLKETSLLGARYWDGAEWLSDPLTEEEKPPLIVSKYLPERFLAYAPALLLAREHDPDALL
jgi:hypothetical protein